MENILLSSKPIEIADYKTYKEATFLISVLDEWDENNRLIPKEVGEKYHSTIVGFPIVAKLIRDEDGNPVDFRGHEMQVIINEDGTTDYRFDTVPIGSVLDSWIETREVAGYDGEKDCIMIKTKLWSDRFPEYFTVLDKLWAENNVKSSWELTVEKSEHTIRGKIIKAFSFLGNCLLGSSVLGAVPGAGVYEYAQSDKDDKSNSELILASALSKDCEDFSDNNTEAKEDNMAKTQEIAEEKVVETPTEASEVKVENTDTPVAEVSEGETSDSENKEGASVETPTTETSEGENHEDIPETSVLTDWDLRHKINEKCRETYRWFWISYIFPAENYVLGKTDEEDENELDYIKFTYTVNGDEVTVGEPEKVTLSVSVAEINSTIAEKNDTIVKANAEIQTLKAENETLLSYKARCEKEDAEKAENELSEKKEALKKYALDSKQITEAELETDEFKKMIDELNKAQLSEIISDRVVASLSKESKVETKVETSEVHTEKPQANLETAEDNEIDVDHIIKTFLSK